MATWRKRGPHPTRWVGGCGFGRGGGGDGGGAVARAHLNAALRADAVQALRGLVDAAADAAAVHPGGGGSGGGGGGGGNAVTAATAAPLPSLAVAATPGEAAAAAASPTGGAGGAAAAAVADTPAGAAAAPREPASAEPDEGVPILRYDDEQPLDLAAIQSHVSAQVATFTADEMRRYEAYRRSDLKKERVKKVLSGISPVFDKMAPSDAYVIAVKGLAKLFVGDVVETAATVAAEWGDRPAGDQGLAAPALQPKHLREAYRRLRRDGAFPTTDRRAGSFLS